MLVISLTLKQTLLNKRVCPTNTTMGVYQLPSFDRIVKCWLVLDSRTGIVYNVTPNAVGVIVYKVVGNRYIEKRVNLRVEHVKHSACRQEFLDRVQANHAAHVKAKEAGGRSLTLPHIHLKSQHYTCIAERGASGLRRIHTLPREAHTVSSDKNAAQTITPLPYETTI